MKYLYYILFLFILSSCNTIKKTDDTYRKWQGDNNIIFYE